MPVDWRDKGKVTPIRNQKSCGSCWAFSAAAAIESALLIEEGVWSNLSEQQLVDCTFERSGCKGGWTSSALNYIIKDNHGITTEDQYKYKAKYSGRCKQATGVIKIASFTRSTKNDCEALRNLLAQAPAAVDVCTKGWMSYENGVYTGCPNSCTVNHAVLSYGYTKRGHWRIKNSWGKGWGNRGRMRLHREN